MPSSIFGHLKRALELSISTRMRPLPIVLNHWVDTITPEKKTNKHVSVIFLLETSTVGFADMPNLMVPFSLRLYAFCGCFLFFFDNQANFLRLVAFDGYDLDRSV